MISLVLSSLVLLNVASISTSAAELRRLCFYPNWGQYKPGKGAFRPENIDPMLCTHIVYAFAKLLNNQLGPIEWNDESTSWSKGMYERVIDLKKINPSLKVMLAVGGWNAGTSEMTKMLSTQQNRKQFIDQSIGYLRRWRFDGLNLNFEGPGVGDSPAEDKQRFTLLIQETRDAYIRESQTTGNPIFLLSIAIPADEHRINRGYELNIIQKNLDFVGLMTYDYHGSWDPVTGHNAPLFSLGVKNLNWTCNFVEAKGVEAAKIIVGLAFYGKCFTLKNPSNDGIGAPATGPCPAGPYTQNPGVLSYYEICSTYLNHPATKVKWSDEQQVTYLVSGNVWIGYDDQKGLTRKLEYINSKKYGGWMAWDLSFDDFNGNFCSSFAKYPLLKTLNV